MLPPTVTECQFLAATDHIARVLYRSVGTVVGEQEDFAQQVIVWSLEALPAYEPGRPLEGFLLTHARNRALNYYRDHVSRKNPPCRECHDGRPCSDGRHCPKYRKWWGRNNAKKGLSRPAGIEAVLEMTRPSAVESGAIADELSMLIDTHLPVLLRADYLRLVAGEKVPKPRREKVQQAVRDILANPPRSAPRPSPVVLQEPDPDDDFAADDEDE